MVQRPYAKSPAFFLTQNFAGKTFGLALSSLTSGAGEFLASLVPATSLLGESDEESGDDEQEDEDALEDAGERSGT